MTSKKRLRAVNAALIRLWVTLSDHIRCELDRLAEVADTHDASRAIGAWKGED